MGTENESGETITKEDLANVVTSIMDKVDEKFNNFSASTTPAPGTTTAPANTPAPTGDEPLTVAAVANAVKNMLEQSGVENANKVYDTLFDDRLSETKASLPGFTDYLEGEDEYGNKRADVLKDTADYNKRVTILDRWKKDFSEASTSSSGKENFAQTKARKKAEDNQSGYDDVNAKWMSGEFKSQGEFKEAWLDQFEKELNGIMG